MLYSLRIWWSDGGYSFFPDIGLSECLNGTGLAKRLDEGCVVQIAII